MLSIINSTQLLKHYDAVKTSFWFIPCLILLGTLLACALLLALDRYSGFHHTHWLNFLYYSDAGIIRSLLTTIASSVMTVVSITFSITIVALTNASSQFGPRLIRNFMEDISTQVVLGVFISLFVYCLILTRMTDSFAEPSFLPGLSIAGAAMMTLFGIFLLIYFIHHVAQNLQSDHIIDNVYSELQNSIKKIFDQQKERESTTTDDHMPVKRTLPLRLKSPQCGYVQAINYDQLSVLMSQLDGYIEVLVAPGDFVVKRKITMLSSITDLSTDDEKSLHDCFTFGSKRTPIQDPEFAVDQLVEIALRALSPGINDPYSSIACVDKLTAMICDLTQETFPQGVTFDNGGAKRIDYKATTFEGLANTAYDQIRQYSQNCLAVCLRQLEGLACIAEQARNPSHWAFVRHQKHMIEHGLKQQNFIDLDREKINSRLQHLNQLLQSDD
ncbi:DUF2254 domain-containing protein [Marinomonas pollencensis]|uniref:Putative membrane protein n=1 Tax=Marinomonas pollencensis TaxID=491954 RepID=A0A3E0DL36_9GAMM|nr:DUF2254 domain-containing protein [Marinomonas pollencensis]REG82246.1 putative membrane protein [Marinomonas pollencensis]